MGITEEGLDTQGMELVMARELRPVVEGDRLTQLGRQRSQDPGDGTGDGVCRLARRPEGDEDA